MSQSGTPAARAARRIACSVAAIGRQGIESRSRASRKAARAAFLSPAAAARSACSKAASAAPPSPSGRNPASLLAVVQTSAGRPAASTAASICDRFVSRLRAAAARNGESAGIMVWPTICSIRVRLSSALRCTKPSTAWTIASPRARRTAGKAQVGSVPEALIEATP